MTDRTHDSDELNELVHKIMADKAELERHTSYGIGGAGNLSKTYRAIVWEMLTWTFRTEITGRSRAGDFEKQPTGRYVRFFEASKVRLLMVSRSRK
jgi:hypothetical protein